MGFNSARRKKTKYWTQINSQMECTIIRKIQTSLEMLKSFFSTSDWRKDSFLLYHWLFWIQSNFQVTKKPKQQKQIKEFSYKEQTFAPRVFHSVSVRTLTERHKQTQSANSWLTQSTNRKARLKPSITDSQKWLFSQISFRMILFSVW